MQQLKRNQGMALMVSLVLLTVVAGIVALLFTRTLNEIRHSGDDAAIVQSLMLARGAANLGGSALQGPIRDKLDGIVGGDTSAASSSTNCWSYGGNDNCDIPADGSQPRPDATQTITDLSTVATALQPEIDDIVCQDIMPTDSQEKLTVAIFVTGTACSDRSLPSGVDLPSPRFVGGTPRGADEDEDDEQGLGAGQTYALPFVMVAEGAFGNYNRRVVLQGEYQFQVGRASFARFGLFTNHHNTGGSSPSDVWFTDRTLFDGPVHTNQHFRFFRDSWFGGEVTSAGCIEPKNNECKDNRKVHGAHFYGENFVRNPPSNPSYKNNWGTHAPQLTAGVDWKAKFIELPEESTQQEEAAEASGIPLHRIFNGNEGDLHSLTLYAGDADGNVPTKDGNGDWGPAATHQYVEACGRGNNGNRRGNNGDDCVSLRISEGFRPDGLLGLTPVPTKVIEIYDAELDEWRRPSELEDHYDDDWEDNDFKEAFYRQFNDFCEECVVYVDDKIDRLTGPERVPASSDDPDDAPPALASFAQMTITAEESIRVTGDLKYEDRPCTGTPVRNDDGTITPALCNNLSAENVLGIYTPDGDVTIGNNWANNIYNAPDNVTIDAVVMSASGAVEVDNYEYGSSRGSVNLLGGIIENYYGAFGRFSASTGSSTSGYGRSFTYDQRMKRGMAPPSFPGTTEDTVRNVVPISFGQREQLF